MKTGTWDASMEQGRMQMPMQQVKRRKKEQDIILSESE